MGCQNLRGRIGRAGTLLLAAVILCMALNDYAEGQTFGYHMRMQRIQEWAKHPIGVDALPAAMDPIVRKWHVPQEFMQGHRWGGWNYTNYAVDPYERYVNPDLRGDYFYDLFGNYITQGWMWYDWTQTQPMQFGNSLLKGGNLGGLLIATDSKGSYYYSLMLGDRIRTTLTPLTFSKPMFNGIQWDFATDRYYGTFLLSRISVPILGANARNIPDTNTNNTIFFGGRAVAELGDHVEVGATVVNAHQSQTLLDLGVFNPFRGTLTTEQNGKNLSFIEIRLMDDSPGDGVGGAAFFSEEILLTDVYGETFRGSEIDFHPHVEGGFQRRGYLAADGNETITLEYTFVLPNGDPNPDYRGPSPDDLYQVAFELTVANDYRVDVTSAQQVNIDNQPIFLTVVRAPGNVKDNSNQRIVQFDYGLPTANHIYGFTIELKDLGGFSLYGELDFNRRYHQYPNIDLETHHTSWSDAEAWYVNAAYTQYPWFGLAEVFDIDEDYSTTAFVCNKKGGIDYEDELYSFYEFVDDNDDMDRSPDWGRLFQGAGDLAVFPGWDENNDFISDFNQNDTEYRQNMYPDYDEPFLRYNTDRPEYLFGMDMNNNGWVDRFENDELADYPYPKDHRGYNVYAGAHLASGVRALLGQKRQRLELEEKRDLSTYGMFMFERDHSGFGRVRIFERLKLVKDNIPNPLFQWIQPADSRGLQQRVEDPLAAQDTWVNTTYMDVTQRWGRNVNAQHKIKYEFYKQRREQEGVLDYTRFLGIINKVDYTGQVGRVRLSPRIKNEFRRQDPFLQGGVSRKENLLIGSVIGKISLLRHATIEAGVEVARFDQLREDESGQPKSRELSPDYTETVVATQLSNVTQYEGYRFTVQVGFRLSWKDLKGAPTEKTGGSFITAFAGIAD